VIKAGKDADGLRVDRPSENISIVGCTVHRATWGRDDRQRDFRMDTKSRREQFHLYGDADGRADERAAVGGAAESKTVRFDNWVMQDVGQAINITSYYLMEGEVRRDAAEPVSKKPLPCSGTSPSAICRSVAHASSRISRGLPEMPISGLKLSNVVCDGARTGIKAKHHPARWKLHNVQVDAEKRPPPFLVGDSAELGARPCWDAQNPRADAPVVRLETARPARIVRASRAFSGGRATFLSTGQGELKTIVLESNVPHRKFLSRRWRSRPISGSPPEPPTEAESRAPAPSESYVAPIALA